MAKVYSLKIHQSQYLSAGLFPRSNPACGPQCTILQEKELNAPRYKLDIHSLHSNFKFILNSLCSPPGIHYPAKDARVRLCPLQRQTGAHPPWSPNKPPLSFPLLESKVAFKRKTVSGFVSQTVKAPGARAGNRAKGWEQEQLVPGEWITTACEEGVEGHGETKPQPKLDSRQKEKGAAVCLWVPWPRELRSYQILLGHTMWPLSFSTFSRPRLLCQCPINNNGQQTQTSLLLLSCAAHLKAG